MGAGENVRSFRLLEAAKRDWEQTFDAIRDSILITDAAGVVVRVNRAARDRLGVDFGEIVGRPLGDLLGDRIEGAVRRALGEPDLPTGAVGIPELRGIFEVSAYARMDGSAAAGTVVVLVDVTEKERLREQLLHSEKLSALGELISGIAHELNNPLTAVLGYAQILSLKADGQFGKELAHLKAESLRASRIVRNLLTFARRRACTREPEDLNDVIRKTASLREYDLRVRDIVVEFDLAPSLTRSMMDRSQMQQVVLNLLNNAEYAIHTVRDGGRIRVGTREERGRLVLTVEDDGPGIPAEVRERIFHPFFTTKPVGRGTGLGLPICFGIVTDHGGEIRVDPACTTGARFVVELPVVPWTPALPDEPEPRRFAAAGAPGNGVARILVVDDETAIRHLAAEYLGGLGHRVELAADGREALEAIERDEFDLVICDLRMPRLGGEELYDRAIGLSPRYRDRFAFVTGDVESVAGRRRPAGPILAKPFDLDELGRVVAAVLR